jgi:hypothetical protein
VSPGPSCSYWPASRRPALADSRSSNSSAGILDSCWSRRGLETLGTRATAGGQEEQLVAPACPRHACRAATCVSGACTEQAHDQSSPPARAALAGGLSLGWEAWRTSCGAASLENSAAGAGDTGAITITGGLQATAQRRAGKRRGHQNSRAGAGSQCPAQSPHVQRKGVRHGEVGGWLAR